MMLIRAAGGSRWMWAGGVISSLISWRASTLILAIIVASGALRLFTEWQRRKTFTALIQHAPAGTMIAQRDGDGGRAMTVTLGGSHSCRCQSPEDQGE